MAITVVLVLNSISFILACAGCIFYMVGSIGYSGSVSVLKAGPWCTSNMNGEKAWGGLQMYIVELNFPHDPVTITAYYAGCESQIDACKTCKHVGEDATVLLIFGTVFSLIIAVLLCVILQSSIRARVLKLLTATLVLSFLS